MEGIHSSRKNPGKIYITGIGPGAVEHLTANARESIAKADVIVGYSTYLQLIRGLIDGKEVISGGMTEEITRANAAIERAECGKTVAFISGGDAGVYGMAGLVYEILLGRGWEAGRGIEVEVVPGVTALSAAASILGAPVMNDHASISLSDLLTPWAKIELRLDTAAAGDFVIALYNPRSARRTEHLRRARDIILRHRKAGTPTGIVREAYRDGQKTVLTELGRVCEEDVDMSSIVVIGNSRTFVRGGVMVTPRGYAEKYDIGNSFKRQTT